MNKILALVLFLTSSLSLCMDVTDYESSEFKQLQEKTIEEFRACGNYYDPAPTSQDCPLPEEKVMNPFFTNIKAMGSEGEKATAYHVGLSMREGFLPWAVKRCFIAASIYSGVPSSKSGLIKYAALPHNDTELLKVCVKDGPVNELANEKSLLSLFGSITKVKHAEIILAAGIKLPRIALHYVMVENAGEFGHYDPALIPLYRKYADPLVTDVDELTPAQEEALSRNGPRVPYHPLLPIQVLAIHAKEHTSLDEVTQKFELLIEGLSDAQKKQMFDYKKDAQRDVKTLLQNSKPHPNRQALLQRINAFYDRLAVEQSRNGTKSIE